ncbi:predicted protein [Uncinocarpus reesii 1704]|uniref:Uncharacterized protein n=1 Tax=Uncinocarpus reesii (strain UAMH 1704) TaxID=336963 RepID=C4JEN9_UNCRE|nr:uncharacterized protein UREG_02199 [Uncinocarpus reesii 1704]EEP77350.1 predicted protein [Uncinocarpus reesii 1704]
MPRQKGFIWPKDPLPGKPLKWPFGQRFKDVLRGKGPDIFVGNIDGPNASPKTPRWARWQDVYGVPDDDPTLPPLFKCCDRGLQRYDFRTRTYKVPDAATWSYVLGWYGSHVSELPTSKDAAFWGFRITGS